MQLDDDEEATLLKKWVVKRLEDISDADSEVLADYVLALVKSDDSEEQIRKNCLENLEDFLREHTAAFVEDVFRVIKTKSFLPGAVPSNAPGSVTKTVAATFNGNSTNSMTGSAGGAGGQSRKRGFNDRGSEEPTIPTGPSAGGERAFKQMRRGGARGNRQGVGNGRGGFRQQTRTDMQDFQNQGQFPGMAMPPGFPPLDPNNPMSAIMAMQAMGFPPMPGFPPFPQLGSPAGQGGTPGSRGRCRDYDTKGFCAAGSACPYEHGGDHIVVPGSADEYDPTNAVLASSLPTYQQEAQDETNAAQNSFRHRRGARGRGRGGRSDRGGRAPYSSAGPNQDRNITTIVVEQIPDDKFTEQAIREFFGEFGTIEAVTLKPYKKLALVKYPDWASAKNAYDSPKVIFDNRFVKVYWYKPDTVSNGPRTGRNGTDSLPSQEDQEMVDPEEFERKQAEAQKAHEEKLQKIKEAESAKEELDRRIKAQAEERKKLLEKLAAKTGSVGPTSSNGATGHIDGAPSGATTSQSASVGQSTSQTEALRAKLAELEAEADSLGLSRNGDDAGSNGTFNSQRGSFRGYGRGGRGYRGWSGPPRGGRGGSWLGGPGQTGGRGGGAGAVNRLDNRPRTVAISGPDWASDSSKEEALRQHLFGIGADFDTIAKREDSAPGDAQANGTINASAPALEISFPARYVAENFIRSASNGEISGVGHVDITWVANKDAIALKQSQISTDVAMDVSEGIPDAGENGKAGGATLGTSMPGGHTEGSGNAVGRAGATEVDYDVAEDDGDRWMAE